MQAAIKLHPDAYMNKGARDFKAPEDLKIPFWPMRTELQRIESYQSTEFWFAGMKKATKKAYKTHLRLFCKFYSTDPDVLIKFQSTELKVLLDAYLGYLIRIAVKFAGKPKAGQVSVNSIPHYFTGLHSFFIDEYEKEINWKRYERKFPEKVANNLRSHMREEVQKMYKAADVFDKPLVLLEWCTSVRVGAIGPMQFEHIMPIPEFPDFHFLKVYADSAEDYYYVVLTPEFMTDLEELKATRERWGDRITPRSYLFCPKFGPHTKRYPRPAPLREDAIRRRMRRLALKVGLDLERLQPNHGLRKGSNTVMKNAHVEKDFKELLMGHSTGLDDTYYDVENPRSRKEIVIEYMKAIDDLTINDENRYKRENAELKKTNSDQQMLLDRILRNADKMGLLKE